MAASGSSGDAPAAGPAIAAPPASATAVFNALPSSVPAANASGNWSSPTSSFAVQAVVQDASDSDSSGSGVSSSSSSSSVAAAAAAAASARKWVRGRLGTRIYREHIPTAGVDPKVLYKFVKIPDPNKDVTGNMLFLENCAFKSGTSVIVGGAMGVAFGFIMGSFQEAHTLDPAIYEKPAAEQMRHTWKEMTTRARSYGRNFAKVGGIYAGVECLIEKNRAKHDIYNSVSAGCITGAALAYKGGPGAMVMGCGGFAVFSAAIDMYMGH